MRSNPGVVQLGRRVTSAARAFAAATAFIILGAGIAHAQSFDENRYYQQCLRFEAGGVLETARQACLNALQVKPDFADAELALARIELDLGDVSSAENRLRRVLNRVNTAEPLVLLAEAALASQRPGDAEAQLQAAEARLATQGNLELEGRVSFLRGRIMQSQGRFREALGAYDAAILGNPLDVNYRLADAGLRLRLGEAASAGQQLQSYLTLTGDDRNADVRSLLGRAQWAQGELEAANGNIATAHQLRGARNIDAQA
ncbi:MAG TPA: tetratricopeptide repeat protein, partial [Trueperaceae bacterium]|nr:tetratricopeptide repeat protein [Trueperaceae bacterium]